MKTKVLFLITKATWGGAQRYIYDLATNLPKDEFGVVVAFGQRGTLAKSLSVANIPTHELPSLGRDLAFISDVASFFQIAVCLSHIRPDVLHLNSSKAAALGALAARLVGIRKIIFTVHGWPFNEERSEFARVMIYFVSWLTAFLSHEVIVVSKSDEGQGKRMRWIEKKMRYIPIGIDPPQFIARDEARAALGIEESAVPHIVTIAELTPNKGLQYGIEALSILNVQGVRAEYAIIGTGEQLSELGDLAIELGVEEQVKFAGFIDDAARYLRAFDIFMLPSVKEGMPYVLLEAAAAGLPIITTSVVDPGFVDEYARIRTVPPGDPEALAEALVTTTRELAKKEPLKAPPHFSLSDMVRKTTALYR